MVPIDKASTFELEVKASIAIHGTGSPSMSVTKVVAVKRNFDDRHHVIVLQDAGRYTFCGTVGNALRRQASERHTGVDAQYADWPHARPCAPTVRRAGDGVL